MACRLRRLTASSALALPMLGGVATAADFNSHGAKGLRTASQQARGWPRQPASVGGGLPGDA